MTGRRALAAVLARMLPSRGRHARHGAPVGPPPAAWEGTGHELTMLDVKPARARPYVQPGDDGTGRWLP